MRLIPLNNYKTAANKLSIALMHNDYDYISSRKFNSDDFKEFIRLLKENLKCKNHSGINIDSALRQLRIKEICYDNTVIPRTYFDNAVDALNINVEPTKKPSDDKKIKKAILLGIGIGCLVTAVALTSVMTFGLTATLIPLTILTALTYDAAFGVLGGFIASKINDKINSSDDRIEFENGQCNTYTLSNDDRYTNAPLNQSNDHHYVTETTGQEMTSIESNKIIRDPHTYPHHIFHNQNEEYENYNNSLPGDSFHFS